jgi:hypothetical protein
MSFAGHFRSLSPVQRNTFSACFLGWTLDAFDFFLLTFCPVRAILPGFAYQLGNLISSRNSVFQKAFANHHNGGKLNVALSGTVVIVALVVAGVTALGPEAKGTDLG